MSDAPEPRRTAPIFVERQSYRRRRLADSARFLPVLGLLLWMLPLLWGLDSDGMSTSDALVYVFAVWLGLVAAALLLIRALGRGGDAPQDDGEPR